MSAERERLIFVASLSLIPEVPVFFYFSDPAKSTKFNFPILIICLSFYKKFIIVWDYLSLCCFNINREDAVTSWTITIHESFSSGLVLVPLLKTGLQLNNWVANPNLTVLNLHTCVMMFLNFQSFLYYVRSLKCFYLFKITYIKGRESLHCIFRRKSIWLKPKVDRSIVKS